MGHCQGRHLYHAAVRVFRLAAHTQGADVAPYASGLGGRDAQDAQPEHLCPTCNGLQPGVALGSGGVMVDAYSRENGASLNPRNFPLRGLYRKGATHHTPPGIPNPSLDTPPRRSERPVPGPRGPRPHRRPTPRTLKPYQLRLYFTFCSLHRDDRCAQICQSGINICIF